MMIKRFPLVLLVLVLLVGFTGSVNAQPREFKGETPANANLSSYPLENGRLTPEMMADRGLTPMRLTKAWVGLNFNRTTGKWEYDAQPTGTLVLADKNGTPWYKESCGNRLVTLTCPECPTFPGLVVPPVPAQPASGSAEASGFLTAFGRGLTKFFNAVGPILGWLSGLLLAAILLSLLALLLAWLWRIFRNMLPGPVPVTDPNQGVGNLGLFVRVELTDAGPEGFTVTGYTEDGRPRFLGFRQHIEADRIGGNGRHRISVSTN